MSIDFSGGVGASMGSWGGGDWSGQYQQSLAAGQNKGGAGYSSFANYLNGNMSQGQANGSGGMNWQQKPGWGGGGGGWNSQGSQQGQLGNLLNQQLALGQQADAKNEANWQKGQGMINSAMSGYNNSAITQGNRNLVQGLQQDPYSINQNVQNQILGGAANSINSQNAAAQRQIMGMMAANGQGSAQDMAALMGKMNRQGNAQQAQVASQLQVQKALQDKQDIMNAAHLGQQQSAQDVGVNQWGANTFLSNMPQYKPANLAGFAAMIPNMGMQGGGGMGMGGGGGWGAQQTQLPQGFNQANRTNKTQDQFAGSMVMNSSGPDNYANAGGGGPGAGTPGWGYSGQDWTGSGMWGGGAA